MDRLPPLRRGGVPPAVILNIAHRGARAFAPENTLEAIDKAALLGCHMVEIDVHLTADGELIVVHDDDLVRCSNVLEVFPGRSYFVSDFSAAEIAQLDAGSWFVAELDKVPSERQPFLHSLTQKEMDEFISPEDRVYYRSGKVRHPTLAAVLERAHQQRLLINVEIKSLPRLYPGIADRIANLVRDLNIEEGVIISSFDHEQLIAIRKQNNRVAIAALSTDRLYDPGRYVRDFLDGDAYHPGFHGVCATLGSGTGAEGIDAVGILRCLQLGVAVNTWTENDPARMKALIAAGVTGIFTDYPNRLRDLLAVAPCR
jgi:glycerophosphoryl diester phosphodiesterase